MYLSRQSTCPAALICHTTSQSSAPLNDDRDLGSAPDTHIVIPLDLAIAIRGPRVLDIVSTRFIRFLGTETQRVHTCVVAH